MPAAAGQKAASAAAAKPGPQAHPILGRQIARQFALDAAKPKTKRWFAGVVEKRVENSNPPLWHVVYDDADSEELEVRAFELRRSVARRAEGKCRLESSQGGPITSSVVALGCGLNGGATASPGAPDAAVAASEVPLTLQSTRAAYRSPAARFSCLLSLQCSFLFRSKMRSCRPSATTRQTPSDAYGNRVRASLGDAPLGILPFVPDFSACGASDAQATPLAATLRITKRPSRGNWATRSTAACFGPRSSKRAGSGG